MRTTGTVSEFHHTSMQKGHSVDWKSHWVTVTVWKMCCYLVSSGQLHHSGEVCFPSAPQPQHSQETTPNQMWFCPEPDASKHSCQLMVKFKAHWSPERYCNLCSHVCALGPIHSLTTMSITDTSVMLLLTVAVQGFTAEWSEALNHSHPFGGRSSVGLILQ